jgi:membrane protease subunit (stomatin/prohibitin family)
MSDKNLATAENNVFIIWVDAEKTFETGKSELEIPIGCSAIVIFKDQYLDVLPAGKYPLSAISMPKLAAALGGQAFDSFEVKQGVRVCFVKNSINDLRWGTKSPIIVQDKEGLIIEMRVMGIAEFKIINQIEFLKIHDSGGYQELEQENVGNILSNQIILNLKDILAHKVKTESASNKIRISSVDIAKSVGEEFSKSQSGKTMELDSFQLTGITL